MSHKVPSQKLEKLLLYWQEQLEKKTSKTVETASHQPPSSNEPQNSPPKRRQKRKHISVQVQRQLLLRNQNHCEFISPITGKRCSSQHFLEKDHKVPVSLGGDNKFENLRIYCRSHNQLLAKKWNVSQVLS